LHHRQLQRQQHQQQHKLRRWFFVCKKIRFLFFEIFLLNPLKCIFSRPLLFASLKECSMRPSPDKFESLVVVEIRMISAGAAKIMQLFFYEAPVEIMQIFTKPGRFSI